MNIRFYNARILIRKQEKQFGILEGELWVRGSEICYIGDGADVGSVCKNPDDIILWDREIDVRRNLLMPGFKDAHTHSPMTFLRSRADDLPLQEWLNEQIFPMEAKLQKEDAYLFTKLAVMEYLTSGITSVFDMYIYPREVIQAGIDCGFRMIQVSGLNNFTSSLEELEEEYVRYNGYHELCSYQMGFHAEYTTDEKLLTGLAELSHKYHAPVYTHISETKKEVEECKGRYGKSPVQLLNELGLYDYGGGGYHCVWFDEEDIRIFRDKKLHVITNPASNLKLASGIAPLEKIRKAGINLAIGTDGAASNNSLDMFREMFLVLGLAKLRENDAAVLDANEVLYMATAGGAYAMGLTDCDCLAVGKKADLIMIDLHQPNMQPENNLTKNLVYSGSKQNIKLTMVNGNILYEDGRFHIGEEPEEIYRKANEIIGKMR
ncbi:MAG: amidohydrolase [Lachnospiraceae bacterium]|nr:amidohydrolase [Lachnospiraceae bacterium]